MRGRGGRASCRAHRSFLSHEGVARAIPRPSVAGNTMPPARSSELLDQRTSIVNGSAGRSWTALGSCMWPYYRQGRPPPTCGGRPWAVERCSAKHILPQGRMSVAWIDEAAATGSYLAERRAPALEHPFLAPDTPWRVSPPAHPQTTLQMAMPSRSTSKTAVSDPTVSDASCALAPCCLVSTVLPTALTLNKAVALNIESWPRLTA